MGQRVLGVDQCIQDLVIVGGREVEELPDSLFFRAGVLPPLPFQRQHLLITLTQRGVASGTGREIFQGQPVGLRRHWFRCWFCHGTLLRRLLGKMSYPHVTGE